MSSYPQKHRCFKINSIHQQKQKHKNMISLYAINQNKNYKSRFTKYMKKILIFTFMVSGMLNKNNNRAAPIRTKCLCGNSCLGYTSSNAPVTVSNIPN